MIEQKPYKDIPYSKVKDIVAKYKARYNEQDRSIKDLVEENESERYKYKYGYLDNLIKDIFVELDNI